MYQDASLTFNSTFGTATAISSTGTSALVDITGAGSGNAPAMIGGFPATNTAIGSDIGSGDGQAIPYLYITVTTAGTGSGTIQFYLQAAPDNGSYAPGTYSVLINTAAFVGASLTLGRVLRYQVPPFTGTGAPPRFYNLGWTVSGTAGVSVLANIVLNPPSLALVGQYPENFIAV